MMSCRPDRTQTCLLIIDMINEFTFDGAEKLFPAIEQTAATIATLKQRAKAAGLPVLYVNDNFGKWRSDFRTLVNRCGEDDCRGKRIAETLRPEKEDYFILKPKHSGFFATPLELLLRHLNIQRVVLTGVAGDNCVLFTAADAYMRNFDVVVPANCTVSIDPNANGSALEHMRETLKADTAPSKIIMDKLAA
jgi:nicotinamidase-related amidase